MADVNRHFLKPLPMIPQKIIIKSDGNELDYVETKKPPKGEVTFIYKYSKSKSKLGELLALNENDLTKLIKVNT